MNNSFSAEGQAFQYRSATTSQRVQKSNEGEFQDAVQRYELRRSSRQRQSNTQQGNVITTKYVQLDDEQKNNNELDNSRYSQRVVEKYQSTSQNSHLEVNRQSVKEVMDKYRRGRGTTASQMTTTEVKMVAAPQQYEQLQQKETVFENRNSNFVDEQDFSQKQVQLNYNTITTKQQVYEEDYDQIKVDCLVGDQYRRPEREDDIQVDLLESDYVSCNIF